MDVSIVEPPESITLLALAGRLDTAGVDRVEARVHAALLRRGHGVLDHSQVTFPSSPGIRMRISAAKLLSRRGSRLALVAPRERVDQAIRHSAIDDIIPVAASIEEARAPLAR